MVFEDRISVYPGRYTMTDENGNVSTVILERADEPTVVGTPLNADTFNGMQEEIQIESEDYPGCYYRLVDGAEQWINPPMVLLDQTVPKNYGSFKFYNTTERYQGHVVKVALVEWALMDGKDGITLGSIPYNYIVSMAGVVMAEGTGEYMPLPYYYDGSNYCIPSIKNGYLYVSRSAYFDSNFKVRLIIKFV